MSMIVDTVIRGLEEINIRKEECDKLKQLEHKQQRIRMEEIKKLKYMPEEGKSKSVMDEPDFRCPITLCKNTHCQMYLNDLNKCVFDVVRANVDDDENGGCGEPCDDL